MELGHLLTRSSGLTYPEVSSKVVNRVQRKIYGPKMGVITGEWRRLHNKGLYDLYSSIIQVIKPRRRWAEHVACMGEEGCTGVWWVNLRERHHLEDLGIDGITLKCIFNKWDWWDGLD